jgi:hypothetical protein
MKKQRSTKPNHRPKPKAKKKNQSPWHKFRAVPEKPTIQQAVDAGLLERVGPGRVRRVRSENEIIIPPVSDVDGLADEIEELENDVDREPDEITED